MDKNAAEIQNLTPSQPNTVDVTTASLENHDAVVDGSGGRRSGKKSGDRVKGPWSPEEDTILSRLVANFGARNWSLIARGIPGRSGKSCRLRWCNQLDPIVKRKPFTGIFFFYFFIINYFNLCLLDFD